MTLRLFGTLLLACLVAGSIVAKDEAKPEPRKTSKADQKRIDAARKEKAAERKAAAKKFKKENEALGKELETLMAGWEKKGFSGAILVMKDGVELIKKGYGYADKEAKRENAADTLYDIGSVTKMFTAAGVLRLEQDGKLKMEDTLGKFFTFAPADKKDITLTQLLSHTSGLSRMYDNEIDFMSRDNTVKGLLGIKLSTEPGSTFEYSNTNYFIAGAVIEVASGEKYEDYVQKQVIDAAGMTDSAFCSSDKLEDKRSAMRYEDGALRGDVTNWPFTWGQRGCGYLVSTVEDFWRWSEAIDNSDFLDEEAKKKWFEVQKEDYALGWCCKDIHETWAQYHGGAAPGARAYFARFPYKDIMYVFFMNYFETGKAPEYELAADLEKLLLDE